MKTAIKTTAGQTAKIIATLFFASGLIFSSCKKDRTCICTTTNVNTFGGTTTVTNGTSTTTIKSVNSQHANLACSSSTSTSSSGAGNSQTNTSNCTLK